MSRVVTEDLVDAIEVLRAARVSRTVPPADLLVFVGGEEVAVAAAYLEAWIKVITPEAGGSTVARSGPGPVRIVVAGPAAQQWAAVLGG